MREIALIVIMLTLLSVVQSGAQNAPVTTAGVVSTVGTTKVVPITVANFTNVGSCNLRIVYDPAIAIATLAAKAPGIGGSFSYNVATPGVVSWGWFIFGGLTLPANTVLFNITFTKISSGNSDLTWDDSNPNYCTWSNSNSVVLNDTPTENYYNNGILYFLSLDAPVTTAPVLTAFRNTQLEVPVSVTSFTSIASFTLSLEYNPGSLEYLSISNNSGFPGLMVDSNTSGVLVIQGTSATTGITLADNSVLFTLTFDYLGDASQLNWINDGNTCMYKVFPDLIILNDLPTSNFYIKGSVSERIPFQITLFLEGAFNNGEMITQLNSSGLVPLSQPYSEQPWNYQGLEEVNLIPENAVDWILIDLRQSAGSAETATSDKSIGKRACFLMQDGSVKDLDGVQNLDFVFVSGDNIYFVVYHRNHLPIITANPVDVFNGIGFYNFSTGESQVLGGNTCYKELSSGIWGMMGGDGDSTGQIEISDLTNTWLTIAGEFGYLQGDFFMDGQVNNKDKNDVLLNNIGAYTQVPEN